MPGSAGKRTRPAATIAALLAAAAMTAVGALEAASQRGGETITYRAREASRIEALEPLHAGAHASQTVRRPVTDLVVRLRPWGAVPLETALSAVGDGRSGPNRVLFVAELIAAANGRIHVEDRATCGPWIADTSICRTECDGGAFALARRMEGGGQSLLLRLGRVPAIQDAGFGEVVRLGACADGEAPGGLAARGGSLAEIVLVPR